MRLALSRRLYREYLQMTVIDYIDITMLIGNYPSWRNKLSLAQILVRTRSIFGVGLDAFCGRVKIIYVARSITVQIRP